MFERTPSVRWLILAGVCLTAAYAFSMGLAQTEAKKKDTVEARPRPDTIRVERAAFQISLTVRGVLQPAEVIPIALKMSAWPRSPDGLLVVRSVAAHGARVKKGDVILQLDSDKISEAIRDLEVSQKLSSVAIELAEKEIPVLDQLLPLELASAERAKKQADEDLQRYLQEDRAFAVAIAEQDVKAARHYLEYAQEELKQLEKMYKADDLVEETEEIILKRQRHYVERAAFYLKVAEKERDDLLKIVLPRRDITLRENSDKTALALARAKATLHLQSEQRKLALEKMKFDHRKTDERLAKLRQDREAMTVRAPSDGVLYYGRFAYGQWLEAETLRQQLVPGGQVTPDRVLMTLVPTNSLYVMAEVDEKDLHQLRSGCPARLTPVGYPETRLAGRLESVSAAPMVPGKFLAHISIQSGDTRSLMPGMACSAKLTTYTRTDAISLPLEYVHTDEQDEDHHYVYVVGDGGSATRRPVRIGQKTDKRVEILEGLKEEEEVLKKKPERIAAGQ